MERLHLAPHGLTGTVPLPWWAAGHYRGPLRQLLLRQRRQPNRRTLAALLRSVGPELGRSDPRPFLVPIPSWKRRPNPLPDLVTREISRRRGLKRVPLLERSRPVLGQHHLNRRLRLVNQEGAFQCLRPPLPGQARRRPVLLVDDILTTGATALNASRALQQAGWRVVGIVILARTSPRRRDSGGLQLLDR